MSYKVKVYQIDNVYQGWGWFKRPGNANFCAAITDPTGNYVQMLYGPTKDAAIKRANEYIANEILIRRAAQNVTEYEVPE